MASYEVRWKKSAVKDLGKLDPKVVPRIIQAVEKLTRGLAGLDAKKLQTTEKLHRLRVGDYRVLFELDAERKIVIVFYVRHRSDAYRGLKG